MPLPRVSLHSFLSSTKCALQNASQQSSPVTFVVGNEAADLDSLCSAIVLAYLRTYALPSSSNNLYIPLSNIPRADLALRPELLPVLSRANLNPNDLITLSDLPNTSLATSRLPPEKTKWILVDHNALQGELGKIYGDRVVGCIDHHDEEHKVSKDCGEEPRVVEKSGSCASLVVEYCREAWDAMAAKSNDAEAAKWNAELASLALGPVLIDTSNLTNNAKTTPTDIQIVEYLQKWMITTEGQSFNTKKYYKEIWTAERDVEGLSLMDLLRKDYKQWSEGDLILGVSSVVKDMDYLLQKAGSEEEFFNVLEKFSTERELSTLSIMTRSSTSDGFKRELFVWGLNENGVTAGKKFEADSADDLGLVAWKNQSLDSDQNGLWRRCWQQQKIENSRKQVAPLLRSSMAG